jgi:hypothetical protein
MGKSPYVRSGLPERRSLRSEILEKNQILACFIPICIFAHSLPRTAHSIQSPMPVLLSKAFVPINAQTISLFRCKKGADDFVTKRWAA